MMRSIKFLSGFSLLLLVIAGILLLMIYEVHQQDDLNVTFLDIGQGDAILISQGSHQVLIDGGPSGRLLREGIARHMPFWDHTVEVVIATHPDRDHIDGLVDLFALYNVQEFWVTSAEKETAVFDALMREVALSQVPVRKVMYGDQISFPSGAELKVIYPIRDTSKLAEHPDPNAISITALLSYGKEVFYLGGDLPYEIEDQLPLDDSITILKAGHHGSNTSTSEDLLTKTKPHDVVISAGRGNRYGHPDPAVLNRILKSGARTLRTDLDGDISYRCNDSQCGRVY